MAGLSCKLLPDISFPWAYSHSTLHASGRGFSHPVKTWEAVNRLKHAALPEFCGVSSVGKSRSSIENVVCQPASVRRRRFRAAYGAPDASKDVAVVEKKHDLFSRERLSGEYAVGSARRYVNHVQDGGLVIAWVEEKGDKVTITLDAFTEEIQCRKSQPLYLHWGIHRSDRDSWFLLEPEEVPLGTVFLSDETEAMQTAFKISGENRQVLVLNFNSDLAPFSLDFVLFQPASSPQERDIWRRNGREMNFCVPVGIEKGSPQPLGATLKADGSVNFALFSRHAEGVVLCLYEEGDANPSMELDLEPSLHRSGDVWHVLLGPKNAARFSKYGYRCKGEMTWENGHRFHSRIVLLDPYAKEIASPVDGQEDLPSPAAALGRIPKQKARFDWRHDFPPNIPMEELVVYRMNVEAFTKDPSSGIDESFRGTFRGVSARADHLKSLGVNAVLLQPIAAFDETQGAYFPINFFAPTPAYGSGDGGCGASDDLKSMVRDLHSLGIEVILEVVYSHTAEISDFEPKPISFRGIDNAIYYKIHSSGQQLVPDFGAQNSFNSSHPVSQTLILDSLRNWVEEFHVDGFVFTHAAELAKGSDGWPLIRPPLFEAIAFDPILSASKIIADPCSPTTNSCTVLDLPHWKKWAELNARFRDDVRSFVKGDSNAIGGLATRLFGSADTFLNGRGPSFGLNFITSFSGLSLADLVSYSIQSEKSWNCGVDGPSEDPMVISARNRQMKNFLLALFLSQGVPVLTMGDEYGRSKNGQLVASERDWAFSWQALEGDLGQQLTRFISSLSLLRQRRRILLQRHHFLGPADMSWHGVRVGEPGWETLSSSSLPFPSPLPSSSSSSSSIPPSNMNSSYLGGQIHMAGIASALEGADLSEYEKSFGDLYFAFNAHQYEVSAAIPSPPESMAWFRVVDTAIDLPASGQDLDSTSLMPLDSGVYALQAFSAILLEARQILLEPKNLSNTEI